MELNIYLTPEEAEKLFDIMEAQRTDATAEDFAGQILRREIRRLSRKTKREE